MTEIICRPLEPEDIQDILVWRNDPVTRQMSRNNNYISEIHHETWFKTMLADDTHIGLIGYFNGKKIGAVFLKIDIHASVSINMNPEHRGKKLSEELLREALREMRLMNPKIDQFIAEIKDTNIASIKIFCRNNFTLNETNAGFRTYILQTNDSSFKICRKRLRIEILTTDPSHPVNPYLGQFQSRIQHDHSVSIVRKVEQVTDGDILFLVSCEHKVDDSVLGRFKHAMVLHASDLPKGRGWSPHIWEILNGAGRITVSLLAASAKIDAGDIYRKLEVDIPYSALWNEINHLLFTAEIELMDYAIINFSKLKTYMQSLNFEPTYYRKRKPEDSLVDPSKSIVEQFDLIRVSDPNRFPAKFQYLGSTYKIILEKV